MSTKEQPIDYNTITIDSVRQYGLIEFLKPFVQFSSNQKNATLMDKDFIDALIFRLILSTNHHEFDHSFGTSPIGFDDYCPDYLLVDFIDQANPTLLRLAMESVLQCPNRQNVQPTRALNFIAALLTLPRLLYPVPRAEPRERPDLAAIFPHLHRLNKDEACHLIDYVLMEAYQLVISLDTGFDGTDLSIVNQTLMKRSALLDLAIIQWPKECILLLEMLSGFVDQNSNPVERFFPHLSRSVLDNLSVKYENPNHKIWSTLAYNLLTYLYFRRPGLMSIFHSRLTYQFVCHPEISHNIHSSFVKPLDFYSKLKLPILNVNQSEIDRLGPILLVSLTSSNSQIVTSAQMFCKSMVINHPRACLRLLPVVAGLSEGRLDLSWTQFVVHKRFHLLFSNLLHFVELLSVSNLDDWNVSNGSDGQQSALFSNEALPYTPYIEQLLGNLVAMLVRFRGHTKHLGGFPKRLSRILQFYAHSMLWHKDSKLLGRAFVNVPNICQHLECLTEQFEEFVPIPVLYKKLIDSKAHNHYYPLSSLISVVSQYRSQTSKHWNLAVMQPFIHKFRSCTDAQTLIGLLHELDGASKRKISMLLHFKNELEQALSHSNNMVVALSIRLLLRVFHQHPNLTSDSIKNIIIPCLSTKLNHPGQFSVHLLRAIPDLAALAPNLAPILLHYCAQHVIFGIPNEVTYLATDIIEQTLSRLILDGFDEACIEHAASTLINRSDAVRVSE